MSNVNFIGIETVHAVEPTIDLDKDAAAHEARLAADIELTKDCEACMDFPVFQHYCDKHQCPFCANGFKPEADWGCGDCMFF